MPTGNPRADSVTIPEPIAPPNTDTGAQPVPPPVPQAAMTSDDQAIAQGAAQTAARQPSSLIGSTNLTIPTQGQPAQPQAQTQSQPDVIPTGQAAPTSQAGWMNHLLKTISPQSNVIKTNPDGTQTVSDARTTPSMANMFMSSILAGMMVKPQFREGKFGPVYDTRGTAAASYQAAQGKAQEMAAAPQKQYDDMQARKLNVVAANVAAAHQYASMVSAQNAAAKEGTEAEDLQTKNWQNIIDGNKAGILASADDYDQHASDHPDTPKARLTNGMTWDELMQSPFKSKMTSQLMIQDGLKSEVDPKTGKTKTVPTFSVLNPDAKITMNQSMVDRAAKLNPQFGGDLFKDTNGNIRLSVDRLAMLNHQITSVDHAEDMLQSISDSKDKDLAKLGITGNVEGRLAAAVRGDSSAMKALMDYENSTAQGGTTADGLNRLLQTGGGDAIFKALGTNRDAVSAYTQKVQHKKDAADALAKSGGNPARIPAGQAQIEQVRSSLEPSQYLSQTDSDALKADIPQPDEDGNVLMNQAQIAAVTAKRDAMVNKSKDNFIKEGNPAEIMELAQNTVMGDVNDVVKMQSFRTPDAKNAAVNRVHELAVQYGLDTTRYSGPALENKIKVLQDYTGNKKGSTGAQIGSYNAVMGHISESMDAVDKLKGKTFGLTRSPFINAALDSTAKQLTNDPDWKAYKTSLVPVQQEISNFLAGGYKADAESTTIMNQILDPHETPERITGALRQLAMVGDVRLRSIGANYTEAFGRNVPNLMLPDTVNMLKKLKIDSVAEPYNVALPKGWVVTPGQPPAQTKLDPKTPQGQQVMRPFFNAAGKDPAKALEFAKENGYTF